LVNGTNAVIWALNLTQEDWFLEFWCGSELRSIHDSSGSWDDLTTTSVDGIVTSEEPIVGTPLVNMKAHLPVGESFGFTQVLRAATSGRAFPQMVFDHWELMNGDPLEEGSKSHEIVAGIRKRKGLKVGIPTLDNFIDKL
jgi:hypothetical protein